MYTAITAVHLLAFITSPANLLDPNGYPTIDRVGRRQAVDQLRTTNRRHLAETVPVKPEVKPRTPPQNLIGVRSESRMMHRAKREDISDSKMLGDMVVKAAVYLQHHKFMDFDRRFQDEDGKNGKEKAELVFMKHFPRPPLRQLHPDVKSRCDKSFHGCLDYLALMAGSTSHWSMVGQDITKAGLSRRDAVQNFLRDAKANKKLLIRPFTTALEMFQFRDKTRLSGDELYGNIYQLTTTDPGLTRGKSSVSIYPDRPYARPIVVQLHLVSHGRMKNPANHLSNITLPDKTSAAVYMCWYTLERLAELERFGGRCNYWDQDDYRTHDKEPFQCALYSFCPDPCCGSAPDPLRVPTPEECRNLKTNPCRGVTDGDCDVLPDDNRQFTALASGHLNYTCPCTRPGFIWNIHFKLCVDKDECYEDSKACAQGEVCRNTIGSYTCTCQRGMRRANGSRVCTPVVFQGGAALEEGEPWQAGNEPILADDTWSPARALNTGESSLDNLIGWLEGGGASLPKPGGFISLPIILAFFCYS